MSCTRTLLIAAAACGVTVPATAQTTALNPTTMTGYAGTAAAHHQMRQRYGSPASSSRQARACANLPAYRNQYGANNAQVSRLESLCGRAGYRVR